MLGFLPRLEEGESFEGYQARIAGLFGGIADFAPKYDAQAAGLPTQIVETLSRISAEPSIRPAEILLGHTLYPILAAFLDQQEADALRQYMLHGGRRTYGQVYHRRFCPDCVKDDEGTRATACYDLVAPIIKVGGDGKAERVP